MILTDYYKFAHLQETKSKSRFDLIECTGTYNPFEIIRNKKGKLFYHYTDVPDNFNAKVKRRADKSINNGRNISSVFVPDIKSLFAYGDVRATKDALLIIFNTDYTEMELFTARGQKNNRIALYNLLADGELNNEIENLRKQAKKEVQ
jgi:hypothetical protein